MDVTLLCGAIILVFVLRDVWVARQIAEERERLEGERKYLVGLIVSKNPAQAALAKVIEGQKVAHKETYQSTIRASTDTEGAMPASRAGDDEDDTYYDERGNPVGVML